jgi:elongation factor Ts
MKISASLVKQLREKTGAGMMDCKRALTETGGDIEAAVEMLKEKGISKAAKKADRIAAEGLCNVIVRGNDAVMLELNSETDFVAKNKEFLALLDTLANAILDSDASTTEEALKVDVNGVDIERVIVDATAKIGEKFSLRNVSRHSVSGNELFGAYKHMGGRIVTLVVLEDGTAELAKDMAMHVAAINPKYLDQSLISQEVIDQKKKELTEEALEEGKPANIVEKMVIGRLNKYLKEICLVNQPFVKNPDLTVDKYMKENNSKVKSFLRLEVGEGIEKRVEDFAAEVAATVNG